MQRHLPRGSSVLARTKEEVEMAFTYATSAIVFFQAQHPPTSKLQFEGF
jgi:hypothetical protein